LPAASGAKLRGVKEAFLSSANKEGRGRIEKVDKKQGHPKNSVAGTEPRQFLRSDRETKGNGSERGIKTQGKSADGK